MSSNQPIASTKTLARAPLSTSHLSRRSKICVTAYEPNPDIGASLVVSTLYDSDAINAILRDPWIASRIRHDGRELGYIDHHAISYHGAYIDGELVGVFMAVRFSAIEVEVHAALLGKATRHGRTLGALFLNAVFTDADVDRVTAYVLASIPSAANYCRRLGFVDEGRRRGAARIMFEPVDVIILGLLRNEWLARRTDNGY